MAKFRVTWNPNTESDLAGYKVKVNDLDWVSITDLAPNSMGLMEYTTPDVPVNDGANTILITAFDLAGNESGAATFILNPPPKTPTGIAGFFIE